MKKKFVCVAPVSHNAEGRAAAPEAVAREVIECAKSGASMVHLHVRDEMGNQCFDLSHFRKTIDLIREESDIVIQGSTGGVCDLSLEERCVSLQDPRVQIASLNMGSANVDEGVYINTKPDIRFWAKEMEKHNVCPEFEVFEAGMIQNVLDLAEEGFFRAHPYTFNLCLGFKGAMPATADALYFMSRTLPKSTHWGLSINGFKNLSLHSAAIGMGADFVRVGFEDGMTVHNTGRDDNVAQVKAAVQLIKLAGHELASAQEVREDLHITKG